MSTDLHIRYTADLVVCAPDATGRPHVLLIQRGGPPHQGSWALPGGHVDPGETSAAAAVRELLEETGVDLPADHIRLVGVFDDPERDPRGPYVSAAYAAWLDSMPEPTAGDDATAARWWPLGDLPDLAFDHADILAHADLVLEQYCMPAPAVLDRVWSLLTDLVADEGDRDGHLAAAADHLRKYAARGGAL